MTVYCHKFTVKPVLRGHSQIDKTKFLMTNANLMKVKSIAECYSLRAFCNTFDLHKVIIGLENQFSVFLRVALLHRFYCMKFTNQMSRCNLQVHLKANCLSVRPGLHPWCFWQPDCISGWSFFKSLFWRNIRWKQQKKENERKKSNKIWK